MKTCIQCGAALSDDAAEGLCVGCLLRQAALQTDSAFVPSEPEEKEAAPSLAAVAAAFPNLEILELIGSGGMGAVYKARQPKLNRFVALKILSNRLARDERFTSRFLREGQLLARLNHPNIVVIHDFGESGGFYYLLMEYVDGVNLRQAMRAEKIEPDQALEIVPKICDALAYAHGEGILHRDIKPENILLDVKGRVKIADFGIGRFSEHSSSPKSRGLTPPGFPAMENGAADHPGVNTPGSCVCEGLTETGQVLGTPSYMAPEQREHASKVDHRADIYSLGVVFYELLTGELPLGRFAAPSEKSNVDASVDKIVLKALEKEREKRQQSAFEMKTEIEQLTENMQPPPPHHEPEPAVPTKPKRFSRLFLLFLAAIAIGVILPLLLNVFYPPESFDPPMMPDVPFQSTSAQFATTQPRTASGVNMMIGSLILLVAFAVFIALIGGIIYLVVSGANKNSSPTVAGRPASSGAASIKFCSNCGADVQEGAYACPKCGFAIRSKRNYCFHCGVKTDPEQVMCVQCGAGLAQTATGLEFLGGSKQKIAAGLFAILLGSIGAHKFYLESWGWGLVYLLFCWTGLPAIAGIVEGILFLTMDDQTFDRRYNQTQPAPFRW